MTVCGKINLVFSSLIILLAAAWFVLMIVFNEDFEDPRVKHQNLKPSKRGKMDDLISMNKVDPSHVNLRMECFDVIEIINSLTPNIIGDQCILIVTTPKISHDNYLHFIHLLYSEKQHNQNYDVPIYILTQNTYLHLHNQKNIHIFTNAILESMHYLIEVQHVKKLCILAFEEGALMTLLTLSTMKNVEILNKIDKVTLINPFNPRIRIFYSNPISLLKRIKNNIISNSTMLKYFQRLRLIIITTTNTVYVDNQHIKEDFDFAFYSPTQDTWFTLNNTVVISSRAMWNVFVHFKTETYLSFQPFAWMLSKFFVEDKRLKLNSKQIQYLFYYRDTSSSKPISENTRLKLVKQCKHFPLENYQYEGMTFPHPNKCICFHQKQSFLYKNSVMLLHSQYKFDVFDSKFQRLYPHDTKYMQYVYLIENLQQIFKLYVVLTGAKEQQLHLRILEPLSPVLNPILSLEEEITGQQYGQDYEQFHDISLLYNVEQKMTMEEVGKNNYYIMKSCEGSLLIYPLHFQRVLRFKNGFTFKKNLQYNCYVQYHYHDYYQDWFFLHWNFIRNLMIFNMFTAHVISKNIYERYLIYVIVNLTLIYMVFFKLMLFENLIILSTVTFIDTILMRFTSFLQSTFSIELFEQYGHYTLILPLINQLLNRFSSSGKGLVWQSWKILFGQLIFYNNVNSIRVVAIKLIFLLEFFIHGQRSQYALLILAVWQFVAYYQKTNTKIQLQPYSNQPLTECNLTNSNSQKNQDKRSTNQSSHNQGINKMPLHAQNMANEYQQQCQRQRYDSSYLLKKQIANVIYLMAMAICLTEDGSVINEIINFYIITHALLAVNHKINYYLL